MKKVNIKSLIALAIFFLLGSFGVKAQYNLTVAQDGSGNYTTIQAAINAAPTGQTTPYVIYIKNGKYHEVVTIPSNKPFIQLIGQSLAQTIISYDNYSGKPTPTGGTYGTSTSATVNVNASDCMLMNLSVENATGYGVDANAIPVPAPGDGPQALAISINADRVVFYNCRFNGGQDTVYTVGPGTRNYFKDCYIDGNTDFIFGNATVIFDTCVIYPRTRLDNGAGGYVTAPNTQATAKYGYVFRDCKLTKNRGTTTYDLARPWQNGPTYPGDLNRSVYLNTKMGSSINPVGWSLWDATTITGETYFGEYNSTNYNGTSVDVSQRLNWSYQLNAQQAANYYNNDSVFMNSTTPQIATWNPVAEWPVIAATPFVPEISVSNLLARKISGQTSVTWNISFPMVGITCDLYRSSDKVNYTKVNTQVSTEDTACNFSYIDTLPTAGSNFYYLVKASKAGYNAITSDTGIISSTPTLYAYGVLGNIIQGVDSPSAPQIYQLSGVNLIGNVTITPPVPFEVSADGVTWYNNSNPLVLVPTGNAITDENIYVRINGTTPGTYSDSIRHSTTGGVTVALYVKGTMLTTPLLHDSNPLVEWPLNTSLADSAAIRVAGIVPSVSAFSSMLGISTSTTYPAFSAKGVAFATNAATGAWSVGAALNRGCYYQFSVVADSAHQLRIDTLLLNASNVGSANGTVGVVYSFSGFKGDSADIAPGISTLGLGLPAANYGAYAHPAKMGKTATVGNNDSTLRFLADSSLILGPNDSLTIRLYFGVGSTSSNRFDYLKNVIVKGHASNTALPLKLLTFTASYKQGGTSLNWTTANEINLSSFDIERSIDGKTFGTIGTLKAKNTTGNNSYGFVDANVNAAIVYYRLKSINSNGTYAYSNTVSVRISKGNLSIYPNPASSLVTITHDKAGINAVLKIYSADGKQLMTKTLAQNTTQSSVDVSGLAKGNYVLVLDDAGAVTTAKFVRQ